MNAAKLRVAQMHHVVCAFYRLAAIAAMLFKHLLTPFAFTLARALGLGLRLGLVASEHLIIRR